MSPPTSDPKALLAQLRAEGPAPEGIAPKAWEVARGLLEKLDSPPPEAVVGLPEPLVLALLEGAAQARSSSLAIALAEQKGPLGKAAKRALYRLKSVGVTVAAAPAPVASSTAAAPEPPDEWPSLVSPVLGNGERAVVLIRGIPGGVQTFELTYSDEQGIQHFSSTEVGRSALRKELKRLREEVAKGGRRAVVEISFEEGKALLAEAVAQNLRSRTPPPPGAEAALRKLDISPQSAPAPLPTPEMDDAYLSQRGAALHDEPEIRPWLPPETEIRQFALAVDALAHSPIQLSQTQRAEGLIQRVQAMAENFFTPERQRLYARRLWAMGRYFELSRRPDTGALARAEGRRLFHGAASSASPFCRRLFEKVLQLTAETAQAEAAPEPPAESRPPSLILTP